MLQIDLKDRVALVTGGSRGIGAGITKALCRAGAHTFFTHTGNPKNQKKIDDLIKEINREDGKVDGVVLDAFDFEKTKTLVNSIVQKHGKIDILVCNVGQNIARSVEETTEKEWTFFLDKNLSTAFYVIKAAIPHMVEKQYGRIILIGSSAAYDGGGGAIDYAAAKAGMSGMMLYLCKAYARKGINTNVVHPCVIETELVRARYSTPEAWNKLVSQIPVGRAGTPHDIGGMVAFLASSCGDYITGQDILLDGGRTIWRA
jgi:NAD(P)-dependent dehydrogenase (short-subunit alcohol dehydrogenase family)